MGGGRLRKLSERDGRKERGEERRIEIEELRENRCLQGERELPAANEGEKDPQEGRESRLALEGEETSGRSGER